MISCHKSNASSPAVAMSLLGLLCFTSFRLAILNTKDKSLVGRWDE